jgi:hypothetical protein
MKHLITLLLLISAPLSYAEELPSCTDEESYDCAVPSIHTKEMVIDMMLENRKGMNLISKTGENGLTLPFFYEEHNIKVSLLNFNEQGEISTGTMKYEILLWDCRGTDACGSEYLWTVTADLESDGYSTFTKYKNTLKIQN